MFRKKRVILFLVLVQLMSTVRAETTVAPEEGTTGSDSETTPESGATEAETTAEATEGKVTDETASEAATGAGETTEAEGGTTPEEGTTEAASSEPDSTNEGTTNEGTTEEGTTAEGGTEPNTTEGGASESAATETPVPGATNTESISEEPTTVEVGVTEPETHPETTNTEPATGVPSEEPTTEPGTTPVRLAEETSATEPTVTDKPKENAPGSSPDDTADTPNRICSWNDVSFLAQVFINDEAICDGAIVNNHAILTTAHCIFEPYMTSYSIFVGSDKYGQGDIVFVQQMLKHEDYANHGLVVEENNIGFLFTTRIITSKTIAFIKLPQPKVEIPQQTTLSFISFSLFAEDNDDPKLRAFDVTRVPDTQCVDSYSKTWQTSVNNFICIDSIHIQNWKKCYHKRSSPLILVDGTIIGLQSYFSPCVSNNMPGLFVEIGQYVEWITTKKDFVIIPDPNTRETSVKESDVLNMSQNNSFLCCVSHKQAPKCLGVVFSETIAVSPVGCFTEVIDGSVSKHDVTINLITPQSIQINVVNVILHPYLKKETYENGVIVYQTSSNLRAGFNIPISIQFPTVSWAIEKEGFYISLSLATKELVIKYIKVYGHKECKTMDTRLANVVEEGMLCGESPNQESLCSDGPGLAIDGHYYVFGIAIQLAGCDKGVVVLQGTGSLVSFIDNIKLGSSLFI